MFKRIPSYFSFKDDRGSFQGLIQEGSWEEMNFITSVGGCVRGNHYHQTTLEMFIILKGKIEVDFQRVGKVSLEGPIVTETFVGGDVFFIEPMVNHAFRIIENSEWINALSKKMSDDHKDIHRVDN